MPFQIVRVKCHVGRGLFQGELIVRLRGRDGTEHETWVDAADVSVDEPAKLDSHEARGEIEVKAFVLDEGVALIELPNETIAAGRRIWVEAASLVA